LADYLARQAEKSGHYAEAQEAFAQSGKDKRQVLREKEARDLYAQIQQVPDPAQRQSLLQQSARQFAGTKYESKARETAASLQKKIQIVLKRSQLFAMPTLLNELQWSEEWLDGQLENQEVDSVAFLPPDFHEAIVNLASANGTVEQQRITISAAALPRVQAALQELKTGESRLESAGEISERHYVPLNLEGGIGGDGVSVYPSLQQYSLPANEQPLYR